MHTSGLAEDGDRVGAVVRDPAFPFSFLLG
jgi:hypothetical protein